MSRLSFGRHKVSVGAQAIVSRPDVPRSTFATSTTHKTTFNADFLYPIYVREVLPGDTLALDVTAFVRMATPVFPMMDNLYVDTFFFFCPNRILWGNWKQMMGETWGPSDTTDFLVPQVVFGQDETIPNLSIYDYFGIPPITIADTVGHEVSISALPLRAYNAIWSEWFRDQNIQWLVPWNYDDGPDPVADYELLRRNKRHDYFTSALPQPQRGPGVTMPLTGSAPIVPAGSGIPTFLSSGGGGSNLFLAGNDNVQLTASDGNLIWDETRLEADLSDVAAIHVNTMRAAVAMQQLLERDARFGTRYVETLRGHFGVDPQDYRLQRPEYLGGSSTPITVTPVAQTSGQTETSTPLGELGAAAVATPRAKIGSTFPEHGFVIGLINVRADLSYQQGLERFWTKRSRFDFAYPVFANLGEQTIRQDEIFLTGNPTADETVFGYQERYAEYRYQNSMISGMFRSGISGTMDSWHLAQYFESAPMLDEESTFIQSRTPMERILSAGELADGQQFIADILFQQRFTRPLPIRGVPGLTRL